MSWFTKEHNQGLTSYYSLYSFEVVVRHEWQMHSTTTSRHFLRHSTWQAQSTSPPLQLIISHTFHQHPITLSNQVELSTLRSPIPYGKFIDRVRRFSTTTPQPMLQLEPALQFLTCSIVTSPRSPKVLYTIRSISRERLLLSTGAASAASMANL